MASTLSSAVDPNRLWAAYWTSERSEATRNRLMEHYLPLVRFAAVRLASKNGRRAQRCDIDDLIQYGSFGLRDAIRGFDPARGVKFETYCLQRIRGAMLDGLKTQQWVPRDLRQRLARYNVAAEQVSGEAGPGTHDGAVASRLGVCEDAIHELRQSATRSQWLSLHHVPDATDTTAEELVADHREEDPGLILQRETVRELFLRELTRTERRLMMLYYYDEMTMREIGAVLGISGTRVSQMHTDIIARLKDRLASRLTNPRGSVQPVEEL